MTPPPLKKKMQYFTQITEESFLRAYRDVQLNIQGSFDCIISSQLGCCCQCCHGNFRRSGRQFCTTLKRELFQVLQNIKKKRID